MYKYQSMWYINCGLTCIYLTNTSNQDYTVLTDCLKVI